MAAKGAAVNVRHIREARPQELPAAGTKVKAFAAQLPIR